MQTIFRSNQDSNYTTIANDLLISTMPGNAQKILLYLLSKPPTWQLKSHDLRKQLGLSAYAIKKGLSWLLSAGFAVYTRLKSGHTIWRIFDKPQVNPQEKLVQSPVSAPQVEIPKVAFEPVIEIKETEERKKLPPPPMPESVQQVVVDDPELIYPEQLSPVQKKAAKHVIKKAPVQLQQDVLFALAYAMAQGKVKSPVAYLNGLVSRANNGTFEPINAPGSTNSTKPIIPIWKGHKEPEKVNNDAYFADLVKRFGDKAAKIINSNSAIRQKV